MIFARIVALYATTLTEGSNCKIINTALFELNKSSSNLLKNKFKKETFRMY